MPESGRFRQLELQIEESDVLLLYASEASINQAILRKAAIKALKDERTLLRAYAAAKPSFLKSLEPLALDNAAPPTPAAMIRAGYEAGVGPMAAVAGAIAEALGRQLLEKFNLLELVVENGGDLWLYIQAPLVVAVYAGLSSLSGKLGVEISPEFGPCGLACSSGTVGPSLSFGKADAAIVLAACPDGGQEAAAVADAWATALGNRIKTKKDLAEAVHWVMEERKKDTVLKIARLTSLARPKPIGALALLADEAAAIGAIKLVPIRSFS